MFGPSFHLRTLTGPSWRLGSPKSVLVLGPIASASVWSAGVFGVRLKMSWLVSGTVLSLRADWVAVKELKLSYRSRDI